MSILELTSVAPLAGTFLELIDQKQPREWEEHPISKSPKRPLRGYESKTINIFFIIIKYNIICVTKKNINHTILLFVSWNSIISHKTANQSADKIVINI